MGRGYMDVDFENLERAYREAIKKKGICKVIPRSRFHVNDDGSQMFSGLVCDPRLIGEQTGVGAEFCTNCIKKKG